MLRNWEKDSRLSLSVEAYFRSGDTGEFLTEASEWIWSFGRFRFGLDEDDCAEIVLHFVKDAEHILKNFRDQGYRNFPAFFTSCIRNRSLNERRKKSRRSRSEFITDALYEERFKNPREIPFWKEILEERDRSLKLVRSALEELEPRVSLIVKMKHRISLDLREVRVLNRKLREIPISLREYYREDEDEITRRRLQRKRAVDRLGELYQILNNADFTNLDKWKDCRAGWMSRRSSVPEEKSFRKIAYYLGASEHTIRRYYYGAIVSFRKRMELKNIDLREAA
ncbi:hypothetical protein CH371_17035 [Leptospira wolffii]|uniref:Sigma-70 family RNA polymerase sigma factor n=1 Tax=Leptospira wolffii TaxID=409998 RepID=A0A2M9Z827_9LEPT|nr:sigma-70 family RNA polymerase sigma factor [Leptospira wolffii]PJZ64482.1 hypothetical protein CH371_17035 [Leptospira wolffii]